jgi:2-polyprenyl-6-hydroxyphenyl methylase / 3-demethylubiquinone-9 3-methyltransferase
MPVFKQSYDDAYFRTANLSFFRRKDVRKMAELILKHRNGGDLLEIGCGDGILSSELSRYFRVYSTDASGAALRAAGSSLNPENLAVLDIERDDINASYDVIVALNVLEHLQNPAAALAKIRRSLRNGGLFIFSAPNNYGIYGWLATRLMNLIDRTHISTLKRAQWLAMFAEEGFEVQEMVNGTFLGFVRHDLGKHFSSTMILILGLAADRL